MAATAGLEKATDLARRAGDLYPQLKLECEQCAMRWEWGTFVLHSLEPAYFELNKMRRGAPLEEEPDEPVSGVTGYGFNAQGKLVVERQLTEFAGRFYETFYRWEQGGTASLHFGYDPKKAWLNVAWFSYDDAGRVRSIDTVYARGNSSSELYQYDSGGRVISVERHGTNQPYGDLNDFRDIEYDSAGNIVRVFWRYPDGRRVLDFERPADGRTFQALRQALSKSLAETIVASLEGLSVKEPAFALGLHYCGAEYQHRLPPNVAIGLDAERRRFVEAHGNEAPDLIWNPAEWKNHVTLKLDEQLSSQCESVNQDIWQNDRQEEADMFVADLAQRLEQYALPFPKTDDFVSYAVNLDNGTFAEALSAQITPQVATQLRRRGLL